ncbi:MAG: ATP-binding protein [Anaerolineae bacterium]
MNAVGYVVGEVRTDSFTFVTNAAIAPPRWEYVVVRKVQEKIDESVREVDVLAQVSSLQVSSRLLDTSMGYGEVEAILKRLETLPPVVVGQAKVLGYLDDKVVRLPRGAAMPGAEVYRAPDDLLRQFFSGDVASGIAMGTLINRPGVEVKLNPNGLRRHLAVIAQTGAGKSYTVGVVLEQLLELGGTVIVFDPNSDYVLMRRDERHQPTPFADRVQVYRLPTEQHGRISDEAIGGAERFTVQFSRLDADEICDLTGISEKATNIRKAVRTATENLDGTDYTPHVLLQELQRLANGGQTPAEGFTPPAHPSIGDADRFSQYFREETARKAALDSDGPDELSDEEWFDSSPGPEEAEPEEPKPPQPPPDASPITPDVISGAGKALKHIERLTRIDIWGFEDVPMDRLLRPMSLSVIDLAGIDQWIADFIVDKVLRETWGLATTEGLARPVFVVLEEAHNFVSGGRDQGRASLIIKRIASEGRKFGIFLVLITQRPYRIHQDTLSQCNSQIIMRLTNPEDQNAVRRASESISESLLADLPGLNVGEAVVLGPLVRVPVMVRVGRRVSQEGGSDIDVVQALENARSEVVTEQMKAEAEEERASRPRTEWQEEV